MVRALVFNFKQYFSYIAEVSFIGGVLGENLKKKEFKDTKGYQNPYIEQEQTTQWLKEKVQKDKQRPTKHTHKTKDRVTRTSLKDQVTRTSLKPGGELRCSGRVSSSCSTSDTRRIDLVTNPVISHEWGKDREVRITTSGTYPLTNFIT